MMMLHSARSFAVVFSFHLIGYVAASAPIIGNWRGELIHRDAPIEVGLSFNRSGDSLQALLDIPALIMAWEPVPARKKGKNVVVTLPFGIGELHLEQAGDSIHASNEHFELQLARVPPSAFTAREFSWISDGTKLIGTYYHPGPSFGKVPLIIMTHGSGVGHRKKWPYRSYAKFYLDQGLGVVLYDRRGEGSSEGDPATRKLAQLKMDLISLLDHIPFLEGVDTARIGIGGGSQAAVIAFMAAAEDERIDYLILSGAPAVPLDVQDIHNVTYYMRKEQEPHEQIDSARAYMRLYFHYVATGLHWPQLEAQARRAEEAVWGGYVDQPLIPEHLEWWRRNYNIYRPHETLPKIDVPVLLLYGKEDHVVPPQENIGLMHHYLGNRATIKVFDRAGHDLELPGGTDANGNFQWPRKPQELFTTVHQWLKENGLAGDR